jgi:hypothetical protein
MKAGLVFVLIIVCCGIASAQHERWYEKALLVKAGESTKDDIERIFAPLDPVGGGLSKAGSSEQGFFRTRYGRLFVNYSLGNCDGGSYLNLNKGVLGHFSIIGPKPVKLSKTKLDLVGLLTELEHTGNVIYSDERRGIRFVVNREKKLSEIHMSLTKQQRDKYTCK